MLTNDLVNMLVVWLYDFGSGEFRSMDVMVRWFCLLFQNQFTPDEVYDGYPVDRLMHDIVLALMAVQTQTTQVLSDFPTIAATDRKKV